jgi:hypothetical protein
MFDPARRRPTLAACLLGACLVAACGQPDTVSITTVRERPEPRGEAPDTPDWHRLRLKAPAGAARPRLAWDLPAGWKHAPTTTRPYNFVLEGDAHTDAYLTAMEKLQGTLLDNVNRWRRQMGQPAVDAQALAAYPRHRIFDDEGVLVEAQGTFTPMGGGEPEAGWMLLGLIHEAPQQFVFFKMVGPEGAVLARKAEFLSLAASFRRETGPASGDEAPSGRPALAWEAPPGWRSRGRTGAREVTFDVEGASASCWVLFLPGEAGGVTANVNRWLGEVGQPPLDDAAVRELPRIPALGTQGVLVEGRGDYRGMSGEPVEGSMLLGFICPLGDRTLFVKMVGPADAMQEQRENFESFCRSLRFEE